MGPAYRILSVQIDCPRFPRQVTLQVWCCFDQKDRPLLVQREPLEILACSASRERGCLGGFCSVDYAEETGKRVRATFHL